MPNETKLTNCVAVHVPDATEFDDDGGRPVDMEKTPVPSTLLSPNVPDPKIAMKSPANVPVAAVFFVATEK
ncbi:MAG TPA: hypothetical protein VK189_02340 [Thermoplasmata archaeon]|nr:hypothetical protein [Thermoplasmata archaeon]